MNSISGRSVALLQLIGYTLSMAKPKGIVDMIREAIEKSGQSRYAIAKGAGVARSQLSRLEHREYGLSVPAIERIADYLNLEIIIRPKRGRKGSKR